jgi:hypothetical protein
MEDVPKRSGVGDDLGEALRPVEEILELSGTIEILQYRIDRMEPQFVPRAREFVVVAEWLAGRTHPGFLKRSKAGIEEAEL